MTKIEILNNLIKQNNEILNNYIKLKDVKNIEKHTAIKDILNQNDAFNKIDSAIAINILMDILNDQNKAVETYKVILMLD